jgi:Beta-galactosidase
MSSTRFEPSVPHKVCLLLVLTSFLFLPPICGWGASRSESGKAGEDVWQVPSSNNLMPHFEVSNGRQRLFVDGRLYTVVATEIPWWDLIYGKYDKTIDAYDYLYPVAEALGLNALKVPVKWSMIEPREGVYDFAYVDHAISMAEKYHLKLILDWFGHYASGDGNIYQNLTGEMYAPYYIVSNGKTYPRAVDADGMVHHNAISYNYAAILAREVDAFRAFMGHIKQVDSGAHTVLMIQVENEISVFGADRHNRKLWRDHSPTSNRLFAEKGFKDDLKYSAWNLSYNWIRPLTDAGWAAYPIPFFHNFVGGQLERGIVGGSPGEDVATYMKNCPHIAFIGLNLYVPSDSSADYVRHRLDDYRISRNLPAITETNSDRGPVAPRLAFIAVGEFGASIFAPWALNVSYPVPFQPYVRKDGSLANGAFALRDAYTALRKALPQISYYDDTNKLKVFLSNQPGQKFSETRYVNGFEVTVSGADDGQAIVIHPSGHKFLVVGYRCSANFHSPHFEWPAIKDIRVETGSFDGNEWKAEGAPQYGIDQSHHTLGVRLSRPEAVMVSW